jgi:hypothetical protein
VQLTKGPVLGGVLTGRFLPYLTIRLFTGPKSLIPRYKKICHNSWRWEHSHVVRRVENVERWDAGDAVGAAS